MLDADAKSLAELDEEIGAPGRPGALRRADPARAGRARPSPFEDLGEYGVHRAAGLVRPSQAAILTAGAIRAVPVLRDGAVVPGHQLTLTLACDHRIVFGALAAGFLRRVTELVAGVSADSEQAAAERIVLHGRQELQARLRAAILRQAGSAAEPMTLDAAQLDRLVDAAAARAGGVLWRRCLAGAATTELGVDLAEAVCASHRAARPRAGRCAAL